MCEMREQRLRYYKYIIVWLMQRMLLKTSRSSRNLCTKMQASIKALYDRLTDTTTVYISRCYSCQNPPLPFDDLSFESTTISLSDEGGITSAFIGGRGKYGSAPLKQLGLFRLILRKTFNSYNGIRFGFVRPTVG